MKMLCFRFQKILGGDLFPDGALSLPGDRLLAAGARFVDVFLTFFPLPDSRSGAGPPAKFKGELLPTGRFVELSPESTPLAVPPSS